MNKQVYYYYCPLCAGMYDNSLYEKYPNRCIFCMKDIQIQKSKRTVDEYFELSKERYGDTFHAMQIFEEEELHQDPNLKSNLEELERISQQNIMKNTIKYSAAKPAQNNTPSTPKCPTCSSTNISPSLA